VRRREQLLRASLNVFGVPRDRFRLLVPCRNGDVSRAGGGAGRRFARELSVELSECRTELDSIRRRGDGRERGGMTRLDTGVGEGDILPLLSKPVGDSAKRFRADGRTIGLGVREDRRLFGFFGERAPEGCVGALGMDQTRQTAGAGLVFAQPLQRGSTLFSVSLMATELGRLYAESLLRSVDLHAPTLALSAICIHPREFSCARVPFGPAHS
jgi:hypothetical protein